MSIFRERKKCVGLPCIPVQSKKKEKIMSRNKKGKKGAYESRKKVEGREKRKIQDEKEKDGPRGSNLYDKQVCSESSIHSQCLSPHIVIPAYV